MKTNELPAGSVDGYESVAEYYRGKSVFITGGTGFVGKVLIEKLLYSCKDIGNLFILIRDKKGIKVEERMRNLIDQPAFSRIKSERPDDLKKIVGIVGDLKEVNLGISAADENILIEKVSIVINAAADVRFTEKLKGAVETNVKGTQYVLNLCHRMKNIQVLVHVSTAYSNTDQPVLEEKVYPARANLEEVLKFIEQPYQDEKIIEDIFFKGLPNNYTFTKGLAENYVSDHRGNIPTIIIRPSVVTPSLKEPLKGWVDNWRGGIGNITAAVNDTAIYLGTYDNVVDIIPVDYVANVCIVAAAKCPRSKDVTVYNECTSDYNPIQLGQFIDGIKNISVKVGLNEKPSSILIFTKYLWVQTVLVFLLQFIPAYAADLYLRAMGKQSRYVKLQSIVTYARWLGNHFSSNAWKMKAENVKALFASLSYADRQMFSFDPSDINWEEYFTIFAIGVKTYLFKK